jgi:hypothetical protein
MGPIIRVPELVLVFRRIEAAVERKTNRSFEREIDQGADEKLSGIGMRHGLADNCGRQWALVQRSTDLRFDAAKGGFVDAAVSVASCSSIRP